MHYVIAGATGFVGRYLVQELLRQGEKITVLVRNAKRVPKSWSPSVQVIEVDFQRINELKAERFGQDTINCFIYLAWDGVNGEARKDKDLQMCNIYSLYEAIELSGKIGCKRFVYTGSIKEYEAAKALRTDGLIPNDGMLYGTMKLVGDFLARIWCSKHCMDYMCIIMSNVFGPSEPSERFLDMLIRRMMSHESIDLTEGKQLYDFIYITDAVQGIYVIANQGKPYHSYYLGNAIQNPLKEFILRAKKVLKSTSELNFGSIPYNEAPLTEEEFDAAKLQKLGFMPKVSFEEGVLECKKWILKEKISD